MISCAMEAVLVSTIGTALITGREDEESHNFNVAVHKDCTFHLSTQKNAH
jgi:hypothetical protein